jgi:hypothetical protein
LQWQDKRWGDIILNIISIVIIGFLILEATNVVILYFFPGSKNANGVGAFKSWEKSKSDPEIHNFVKNISSIELPEQS